MTVFHAHCDAPGCLERPIVFDYHFSAPCRCEKGTLRVTNPDKDAILVPRGTENTDGQKALHLAPEEEREEL